MPFEILTYEEYQRKQTARVQNPSPQPAPPDVEEPGEHYEQDDVVCCGGRFPIHKTKLSCLDHTEKPVRLQDPLLLGVKMFLADIPYIIKGYYDLDKNNCYKFSKDVQEAATKRGIRCGLVIISFYRSFAGHAIVAFETDCGLKFFEPQSANEEDVVVGRRYSATLAGIPDYDIIIKVEISWNDGTYKIME